MGPDEAGSAIDRRRDLGHALDAHAFQQQAGALALAREADPRSGLRHGLPDRRPPHADHAQVYSLSLAEMPSAQPPTTAATSLLRACCHAVQANGIRSRGLGPRSGSHGAMRR